MRACVGCGCTDLAACDPPCWWVETDPPLCSTCEANPGTLRRDLRDVGQALAPALLTIAQTVAGPCWTYIRDRQLIRLRRRFRVAATRALDVRWAVDPARPTTCPRRCAEGHDYVWPCQLAPALPDRSSPEPDTSTAEGPDWWEADPDPEDTTP